MKNLDTYTFFLFFLKNKWKKPLTLNFSWILFMKYDPQICWRKYRVRQLNSPWQRRKGTFAYGNSFLFQDNAANLFLLDRSLILERHQGEFHLPHLAFRIFSLSVRRTGGKKWHWVSPDHVTSSKMQRKMLKRLSFPNCPQHRNFLQMRIWRKKSSYLIFRYLVLMTSPLCLASISLISQRTS